MYLQQGELYMSFPADLSWENSNQLLTVLRTQLLIFFNNIFPCLIWITILLIDISCIFTTSFQVLKKPDLNLSCFSCLLCNKLKSIADYWEPRWNFIITPVCKYCPLTSVFITILQTPRPIFTGKISCTPLNTNLIATLYQIQLRIYRFDFKRCRHLFTEIVFSQTRQHLTIWFLQSWNTNEQPFPQYNLLCLLLEYSAILLSVSIPETFIGQNKHCFKLFHKIT